MDIHKLKSKIIPPMTREHREGFDNEEILLSLNEEERDEIIIFLNDYLSTKYDPLVIESMIILNSKESINTLKVKLGSTTNIFEKIDIISGIYSITKDLDMIIRINETMQDVIRKKLKYSEIDIVGMLSYLLRFDKNDIKAILEHFSKSRKYLISYHAKKMLDA